MQIYARNIQIVFPILKIYNQNRSNPIQIISCVYIKNKQKYEYFNNSSISLIKSLKSNIFLFFIVLLVKK